MADEENKPIIATPKDIKKEVMPYVYDALRDAFTKNNGKKKVNWTKEYVDVVMQQAMKDPNSPVGMLVAKQIFKDDILTKVDAESEKMLTRDRDFLEYRILKTLYREQQNVYGDRQSKNIIALCSRRVGKTELAARLLLRDAMTPKHHAIYFGITHENAIRQCFTLVQDLVKSLGIVTLKESRADGEIVFANGSNILFKGNNDVTTGDKTQGGKYSLVVFDEIQSQRNVGYIFDNIIKPAMTDYPDSQLVCLGTPPRVPHTYAEKIWNEFEGWSRYNWNMWKNPYINQNIDEYLKSILKEKGLTKDAPFIQREFYGTIGVYDKEAQVFKDALLYDEVDGSANEYIKQLISKGDFHVDYVYGGEDFGFEDYNSIVMVAWDKGRRIGYVMDNYKFNRASTSEIVERTKQALNEAQELLLASNSDPHNVAFYVDTNEKSLAYEMSFNHGLPVYCAYKHNKMEALSTLAELSRTLLYTPKGSPLADEFESVVYKRDEQDNILPELDEDTYHGDSVMAYLYLSRQLVFDNGPWQIDEVKQEVIESEDFTDEYLNNDSFAGGYNYAS